jgi:OPA family glycerol-3-phosphate transporter-like MFS transporter
MDLLKRIFTNPIMITLGLVEFTAGVLRNGIMQWYPVFAKEVPQVGAEFFMHNWGLLLCITGVIGGFAVGYISDKFFQSRRGPPAAIMGGLALVLSIIMALTILKAPMAVGFCAIFIITGVIGITSITSGTAAADFGGKKATATASGIVDGCVYLGSGVQSVAIGYLATHDWHWWPLFLIPFGVAGTLLAVRIWKDLPAATKKYLITVEKIHVDVKSVDRTGHAVTVSEDVVRVTRTDA